MADAWDQFKDADDPWAEFSDEGKPQAAQTAKPPGMGKEFLSAALRPIAKGVSAVPLMAMDAGVAARNLITGSDYDLPSKMFNEALDSVTVQPSGVGSSAELVSSMLLGSRLPMPSVGRAVPENFAPPSTKVQQSFQAVRGDGAVVPPSTLKPTVGRRLVETLGGKIATEQDASIANQPVWDRLARRAIGLGDDATLDKGALSEIRNKAAPAYEAVRAAGTLKADPQYAAELASVTQRFRGAAKDFPGIAKNDIDDIVKEVGKESFDSDSAIDAIAILRDNADKAFRGGDKALSKAYRNITAAMERLIERNLTARGEQGAELLKDFREARQLIAKTYSVEGALNESTGRIAAQKLGEQLKKKEPLSGELRKIAEFSRSFPKASREVVDSGSVRNTDAIVSGATAGLSGQPWYLLYPFARMAARRALLSEASQNALSQAVPSTSPGLAGALSVLPPNAEPSLADFLR